MEIQAGSLYFRERWDFFKYRPPKNRLIALSIFDSLVFHNLFQYRVQFRYLKWKSEPFKEKGGTFFLKKTALL